MSHPTSDPTDQPLASQPEASDPSRPGQTPPNDSAIGQPLAPTDHAQLAQQPIPPQAPLTPPEVAAGQVQPHIAPGTFVVAGEHPVVSTGRPTVAEVHSTGVLPVPLTPTQADQPARPIPSSADLKKSPAYILAYEDDAFLHRDELRPSRIALELMKPTLLQNDQGVVSTIVLFGSARIPSPEMSAQRLESARLNAQDRPGDPQAQEALAIAQRLVDKSRYYDVARRFATLVSQYGQATEALDFVICTGGGPGIMEAGNRGAWEAGCKSIGLNITLLHEQEPNPYVSPELCFQFHYFAMRKIHFLMRASALVVFPGGFGTFDELFETLTLVQTRKMKPIPIVLCGQDFWQQALNFEFLIQEGVISRADLDLFVYAETPEDIWAAIQRFWADEQRKSARQKQFY